MKPVVAGIWWAVFAAMTGCAGGTETDNPATTLTGFESSACKNRDVGGGQQGLVLASEAEGLQCVGWDRTEQGGLVIRLLNFPEPCGEKYRGKAEVVSGALMLSVFTDTCVATRCGTCVYDFDFEIAGAPKEALRVRLGSALCETAPTTFSDEVTLPANEPSGTICRPLARGAAEQYGSATGTCGNRNMPCGDCKGVDESSCGAELTCGSVGSEGDRCLSACESDDDCALATCEAGLCVPRSDF